MSKPGLTLAAVLACVAASLLTPAARAGDGAGAPKADAAPPAAGDGSLWNKFCAAPAEGKSCRTVFESLNPQTLEPTIYFGVETGGEAGQPQLTVIVPPGMAKRHGVTLSVFQKDQWDKLVAATKAEQPITDKDLGLAPPVSYAFRECNPTGRCLAVGEMPAKLLDGMKTGVGLIVRTVSTDEKTVDIPLPLKGFGAALSGPPTDAKAFAKARAEQLERMRAKEAPAAKP